MVKILKDLLILILFLMSFDPLWYFVIGKMKITNWLIFLLLFRSNGGSNGCEQPLETNAWTR